MLQDLIKKLNETLAYVQNIADDVSQKLHEVKEQKASLLEIAKKMDAQKKNQAEREKTLTEKESRLMRHDQLDEKQKDIEAKHSEFSNKDQEFEAMKKKELASIADAQASIDIWKEKLQKQQDDLNAAKESYKKEVFAAVVKEHDATKKGLGLS